MASALRALQTNRQKAKTHTQHTQQHTTHAHLRPVVALEALRVRAQAVEQARERGARDELCLLLFCMVVFWV